MLNTIKAMIKNRSTMMEAASLLMGAGKDIDDILLDDTIVLGEAAEDEEVLTGEEDGTEVPEENDDAPGDPTEEPVDDSEPTDSAEGEEPAPLPGDDDLPEPVGRQTGETPISSDDDLLNMEINLGSNTLRDVLPTPPASAGEAIDDDLLSSRIDDGFGGEEPEGGEPAPVGEEGQTNVDGNMAGDDFMNEPISESKKIDEVISKARKDDAKVTKKAVKFVDFNESAKKSKKDKDDDDADDDNDDKKDKKKDKDDDKCPECGNDPCTCEDDKECEGEDCDDKKDKKGKKSKKDKDDKEDEDVEFSESFGNFLESMYESGNVISVPADFIMEGIQSGRKLNEPDKIWIVNSMTESTIVFSEKFMNSLSEDELDIVMEAIAVGDDQQQQTDPNTANQQLDAPVEAPTDVGGEPVATDTTTTDSNAAAPAEDNAVTAAVKDKVAEIGDESPVTAASNEELLKKLSNVTKSIEDIKKGLLGGNAG